MNLSALFQTERSGRTVSGPSYSLAPMSIAHLVYDRLIALLENRSVVNVLTGFHVPSVIHPRILDEFRRMGMTELDIEQTTSSMVDGLRDHPNWQEIRDIPKALYNRFEREGRQDEIFHRRIVAAPSLILNALVCEKLLILFQRTDLLTTSGFIVRDDGDIRIDIDAHLARQGFLVPMIRSGLIEELLVFRRPSDERPFILRSREERHNV